MERIESHASFRGRQEVWKHASNTLACEMRFAVYVPRAALQGQRCPVLYWLSGLTCTEQNFITKSGIQHWADETGLVVVAPDTSPRGAGVPDDPAYDLGQGASFYVNATQAPWAAQFRMYDYVVHELPAVVEAHFAVTEARGISGHSMGGHGALMIALRNPGRYRSISAFAPIVAPSQVPWGRKAFTAYLGGAADDWKAYDTLELLKTASERLPLLVDFGEQDEFLAQQLRPELLVTACEAAGHPLQLRLRPGHDHSYYFVSTFLENHVRHHARQLY